MNTSLLATAPAQQQQSDRGTSKRQPIHVTPRAAHALLLAGALPEFAIIDGPLTFEPGSEPIFPRGVRVRGSLSVAWCGDGLKLGRDMTVEGMADFSMTSLAAIPAGLTVKMALDVSHTSISEFPPDMQVGWKIVIGGNVTKGMKARVDALDRQSSRNRRPTGKK
jgi:hypothetical protein